MPRLRLGSVIDRADPDDLAALASAGLTDVRLNVRWGELQPREGQWSDAAFESVATAATAALAAGLQPWLALLGRNVPPWFDDLGGFADTKAAGRWWPRYVGGVADRVGDLAGGWFPMIDPTAFAAAAFAGADATVVLAGERALVVAWRDAWRILRGRAPVATALAPHDRLWPELLRTGEPGGAGLPLDDLAGACDLLGVVLTASNDTDSEDIAERLVRMAEDGPERPLALTVRLDGADDEARADAAERIVDAIRLVQADDVAVDAVFGWPLLRDDGAPSPAAGVWTAQLRPR